ncbi:2'-5' RNA ligase superfamily protein [Actinopolyspora mzabensis]|uniref:2'-5' RNA ligase superfamily protein n=1 Tax=Actinopolyspora mzabensis TaxID=995066 RepID=A0A1G8Y9L3_ACTMZ|nr:2'-5' RNA ligase family protein [Actinopolyspora mzabensis]SDJ99377.1 2'-5' RNA ligase superfamily protein [Actinopolyspora mzabensis]
MSREGRTGLVVPVPAADEALAPLVERYPQAVRDGVPAHLSVLYPFLAAEELDTGVVTTLRTLFDRQPPLRVVLERCRRQGGFVYLAPEPVDALRELTDGVRRYWPHLVPYEGRYDMEPHVTVAMGAEEETAVALRREAAESVPLTVELGEAWLVVLRQRWQLHERFVFGGQ